MEISETTGRKLPELRNPDFVAAFAGWSDAAQVATGTILYLARSLDATGFAQIEGNQFYDFSITRPKVTVDRGLITSLQLPLNSLFYWKNQNADHDLVLLHGIEPQLHWQKFVDTILDLTSMLKVRRIYALGGLYDSTPHTKETRISGLANKADLLAVLQRHSIEPINYQGPSSLNSLLLTNCARKNIEAVSLWGHAPFYVRVDTNPMVCLGLVEKLTELLEIEVDTEELIKAGENLQNTLNQLLADSEELRHYIQKLEKQYEIQGTTSGEPLQGADRIIKEVEDFLRDQRHRGEPQ